MKQRLKKIYSKDGQDRLLPRLSLFLFDRARLVALLWVVLTVFGVVAYTNLLKREGFPSVNIPYSVVRGTYFVNDPAKVDAEVARPIGEIALKDERVQMVRSSAMGSFYTVVIQYGTNTNADAAGKEIEQRIQEEANLPREATFQFETPKFGFTERGDDGVVTVYAKNSNVSLAELKAEGEKFAEFVQQQNINEIDTISVVDPFLNGNTANGQNAALQTRFDRYGERKDGETTFYNAVAVGFMQKDGTDVISLNDKLEEAVAVYNREHAGQGFQAAVTATFAQEIKAQISELQRVLLEALVAILVVGSIVIAIRASLITILSMITVLAMTLGALYLMGQTLNVITLFSLILCLALIVDDTIIMIEAIDAQRRRRKDPRATVRVATQKVSRAMISATLTAALSFAPLFFVSGVLGGFIRAIPQTVVTALLISLFVALIFIPFFARYLLLGKKQMGEENVHEPAAEIEAKIARFVAKPMLWARNSTAKLFSVGIVAVLIGFLFVGAGGYIFQKVTFNIFPPTKDSNGLIVQLNYNPGTTIEQAEEIADKANKILADTLGDYLEYATYYANATAQNAMLFVQITPYSERDITAPQLVEKLEQAFEGFETNVAVRQQDIGPPAASFSVRVETEDREAALRLAKDISDFLARTELVRSSGEKVIVTSTGVSDPAIYTRADDKMYVEAFAGFDGTDTTTLVTLAQNAVDKEFTPEVIESKYGLPGDVLKYDFGQESENQESFQTLLYALPVVLLAIYILLAVQFRSLLQPLLIFLAIPFSFFGITLGLYLSDNAFSFFAMLGFFALIGLSIKNTILLVDYANQMRREGAGVIDAAVSALGERFRPLIATSLTAVVSLIPLAIISPFWEGLAILLIGGLLSSTFLVVTVFPYYYLGAEFLRLRVGRKNGVIWVLLSVVLAALFIASGIGKLALLAPILSAALIWLVVRTTRQRR